MLLCVYNTGSTGGPLDPDAPTSDHMALLTQRAAQAAAMAAALPEDPPEVHPEQLPTLYVVSHHVGDEDFPR